MIFLTHWGRVTHICVSKLTIISSDNGLSPGRRQAIIWTNAGILSIGPLGTNFSEILIGIQTFPFLKMHLKISSAKWRPFCLGLNVLKVVTNRAQEWCFLNKHEQCKHLAQLDYGTLFTKQKDVLLQDLTKSWSHKISYWNDVLEFYCRDACQISERLNYWTHIPWLRDLEPFGQKRLYIGPAGGIDIL